MFTSPQDDHIGKAEFLGRCFPTADLFASQEILQLANVGDDNAAASLVASASPTAPPLLVMHGEADRLIPVAQATMLHDAWTTAGAPVEQVLISGADHTFPGVDESALFAPVSDFLRRHLQPDR